MIAPAPVAGAFPDSGEVACATHAQAPFVSSDIFPPSPDGCAALIAAFSRFTCRASDNPFDVPLESERKPAFNPNAPYDATHRRPAVGEAIDCYDGYRLLPDPYLAFGGESLGGEFTACGPGEIPRPRSERANLPPGELQRVERIEACPKQAGCWPE